MPTGPAEEESLRRPGTPVHLRPARVEGAEWSLPALVEDATDEGLRVRLRGRSPLPAALRPGLEAVLLRYERPEAVAAAVRVLEVAVGRPAIVRLTPPGRTFRMPARHFFRIGVDLEARGPGWSGHVVDLGGGGCRLLLRGTARVPVGAVLAFRLALSPPAEPLRVRGEVVRAERRGEAQSLALRFVGLGAIEQDVLVRTVLRRQGELLRRGLAGRVDGAGAPAGGRAGHGAPDVAAAGAPAAQRRRPGPAARPV